MALDEKKLMNDLQEKAKDLYTYLPICSDKNFSKYMEVTLYDLIPNLDEVGVRKLIGRLDVLRKNKNLR